MIVGYASGAMKASGAVKRRVPLAGEGAGDLGPIPAASADVAMQSATAPEDEVGRRERVDALIERILEKNYDLLVALAK